jgi:hypothetical protein
LVPGVKAKISELTIDAKVAMRTIDNKFYSFSLLRGQNNVLSSYRNKRENNNVAT